MPPYNDNLADAAVLTGTDGEITADTLDGSTYEVDEPNQRNAGTGEAYGDGSIWYVWQAPADGSLWVNIIGSVDASAEDIDTYIYLYSADTATPAMADLVYETEDDDYTMPDSSGSLNSGIDEYPVTAGRYYFLQVQSYAGVDLGSVVHVNWSTTHIPGVVLPPPPPPPPPSPAGTITYPISESGNLVDALYLDACALDANTVAIAYREIAIYDSVTATWNYGEQRLMAMIVTKAGDVLTLAIDPVVIQAPESTGQPTYPDSVREPRGVYVTRIDDFRFLVTWSLNFTYPAQGIEQYACVCEVIDGELHVGERLLVSASATYHGGVQSAAAGMSVVLGDNFAVVCWMDYFHVYVSETEYAITVLEMDYPPGGPTNLSIFAETRQVEPIGTDVQWNNEYLGHPRWAAPVVGDTIGAFWAQCGDDHNVFSTVADLFTVAADGTTTFTRGAPVPMQDPTTPYWTQMQSAIDPVSGDLVVIARDSQTDPPSGRIICVHPSDPATPTLNQQVDLQMVNLNGSIYGGMGIDPNGVILLAGLAGDIGTQFGNSRVLEAFDLPNVRSHGITTTTYVYQVVGVTAEANARNVYTLDDAVAAVAAHEFVVVGDWSEFVVH